MAETWIGKVPLEVVVVSFLPFLVLRDERNNETERDDSTQS